MLGSVRQWGTRRRMNRFIPVILFGALSCATSGLPETMVIIASQGRGMGCQVFQKGLGQPTARWTSGPLIADWDSIVSFNPKSGGVIEKGTLRRTNAGTDEREIVLQIRNLRDGRTTPVLSIEQIASAIPATKQSEAPNVPRSRFVSSPQMSPDGKWAVFQHSRRDTPSVDLWLYDISRRVFVKISDGDRCDETPVWSPDATRVAFYRTPLRVGHGWGLTKEPGYALWVWDTRSGKAREIAPPSPHPEWPRLPAVWSPDGSRILAVWGGSEPEEPLGLCVVDMESGNPLHLTNRTREGASPSYSFSPDGRLVLYVSADGLHTVQPDGKNNKTVLAGQGFHLAKWNCVGSHIIFSETRRDRREWFTVRSDGSDLQPIVPPPGYRIVDVFTYME